MEGGRSHEHTAEAASIRLAEGKSQKTILSTWSSQNLTFFAFVSPLYSFTSVSANTGKEEIESSSKFYSY
jgi:hypothetical protein